jgi:hypothetical protein
MHQSNNVLHMKRLITLLTATCLYLGATAQTVENIRVEQEGDNILVHYRIGGSSEAQVYSVKLDCSVDGGSKFEPATVIGDVGENIRGGKSNYTITWDVFEDLDGIGEAEFFVSVELTRDLSPEQTRESPQGLTQIEREPTGVNLLLAYSGSTLGPYGFSTAATYKKWGGYVSFRFGVDDPGAVYYMDWRIYVAGILRQIVEKGRYKLYLYAGAGAVNEYYEDYSGNDTYDYVTFLADGGIVNTIGRVSLTLGVEYINSDFVQPVFGIGYMFPIKRKVQ